MSKPQTHTVIKVNEQVGQPITLQGWVHTIRNMGKIAFIEIRDHTAVVQVVADDPAKLPKLGPEYVVRVEGKVRARGERFINKNLATGGVEVGLDKIEVINESAELPFEIKKDTLAVTEELRLKHRYLDLRSERMTTNLRLRHKVIKFIRDFLDDEGFIEIETPMLTKGTPEGAREFLVPSRLHPETFYVLPQSPQQFKQLLMVGGVGRYFQIARCMRDEDQRGDRQPEFTQLDLEMSFVTQEDIIRLNERLMVELAKAVVPGKKLTKNPFPRLTYAEAMEKYGTDKPDLRKDKTDPAELAFAWVVDFPLFEKDSSGNLGAVHHPFTAPKPEDIHKLDTDPLLVRADCYDLVLNGYEISSGSLRIHDAQLQRKVFNLLGLNDIEIEAKFGHIIEAFKYGAPPHGGMAPGLDRLIMIFANEPNIREVIAFPKTGDARDPLTGAPAQMPSERQLEAHIKTVPQEK